MEDTLLSEISQREKEKYYMILNPENLKYIYKNKTVITMGEGRNGNRRCRLKGIKLRVGNMKTRAILLYSILKEC